MLLHSANNGNSPVRPRQVIGMMRAAATATVLDRKLKCGNRYRRLGHARSSFGLSVEREVFVLRSVLFLLFSFATGVSISPATAAPCKGPGSAAPGTVCNTTDYGGAGGAPFRDVCPAGYYLTFLKTRSGAHIDQITAGCQPVAGKYDGTRTKYLTARGGNGGGDGGGATCIGQIKAINVNVTTQSGLRKFVRSIELICNPGAAERNTSCAGYYGRSGVTCNPASGDHRFFASCPQDMVAIGIVGRSGSYLDSFGLVCGPADGKQVSTPSARRANSEQNANRGGGDYRRFEVPIRRYQTCKEACEADRKCQAYTYVWPGVQGPKSVCWLKDSVPAKTPDRCCVSGVIR